MLSINDSVRYQYILWFYLLCAVATGGLYVAGHIVGVKPVQGYWMVTAPFILGLPYIYALHRKQVSRESSDSKGKGTEKQDQSAKKKSE